MQHRIPLCTIFSESISLKMAGKELRPCGISHWMKLDAVMVGILISSRRPIGMTAAITASSLKTQPEVIREGGIPLSSLCTRSRRFRNVRGRLRVQQKCVDATLQPQIEPSVAGKAELMKHASPGYFWGDLKTCAVAWGTCFRGKNRRDMVRIGT